MRKIEQAMIEAVKTGRPLKSGNTQVNHAGSIVEVYLYGSLIARNDTADALKPGWRWNLCGFNTATTRSRINALAGEFRPGWQVGTQRGTAYVRNEGMPKGKLLVPHNGWF